jgi:hypothetical protein
VVILVTGGNMPDRTVAIQRKISALKLDIIDMGQRLAEGMRLEDEVHYFAIRLRGKGMRRRGTVHKSEAWWTGTKPGAFVYAMAFPTARAARAEIVDCDIENAEVVPIDDTKDQIIKEITDEICYAVGSYQERDLCPICKKRAATKPDNRGRRKTPKKHPCCICDRGEDIMPTVEDFAVISSPMAQFQDLERTPSFTQEDFELLSKEASRRRMFPREALTMKNACLDIK